MAEILTLDSNNRQHTRKRVQTEKTALEQKTLLLKSVRGYP